MLFFKFSSSLSLCLYRGVIEFCKSGLFMKSLYWISIICNAQVFMAWTSYQNQTWKQFQILLEIKLFSIFFYYLSICFNDHDDNACNSVSMDLDSTLLLEFSVYEGIQLKKKLHTFGWIGVTTQIWIDNSYEVWFVFWIGNSFMWMVKLFFFFFCRMRLSVAVLLNACCVNSQFSCSILI